MDLKEELKKQAARLLQDPRVIKAMQDPRVMQGLVGAVQLRTRLQQNLESGARRFAKSLSLATEAELRELRRKVRRLEQELQAEREASGQASQNSSSDNGHAA